MPEAPAREARSAPGRYLWGVGRGKSFLMDNFYLCAGAQAPGASTTSCARSTGR